MRLLFADGIDIPFVLGIGIVVLIPLMAFEVLVEAFVLKKIWSLPFQELRGLTFRANCWSLIAGIPTKILNAFLYAILLPQDIPGFFMRYPLAVSLGSLIYFGVTVLVEGACAFSWLNRNGFTRSRQQIWRGILLANVATYAVLAPIHYIATKPINDVRQFTTDTRWTAHPAAAVLFVSDSDQHLKFIQADGSGLKTIVPYAVADYLVSSNLNLCLFRGTNGNLYLYRGDTGKTNLIWQTKERFFMGQVAFSPSGEHVAFASEREKLIEWLDVRTLERAHVPFPAGIDLFDFRITWSPREEEFFATDFRGSSPISVTIVSNSAPVLRSIEGTNSQPVLACYGRLGQGGRWFNGPDWGVSYSRDTCGAIKAFSERGLGSGLRIFRPGDNSFADKLGISVNPGLLHLSEFSFGDVAFLGACDECLFESNGYLYLLDIPGKRLGTLAKGDRFILLNPRFAKTFP